MLVKQFTGPLKSRRRRAMITRGKRAWCRRRPLTYQEPLPAARLLPLPDIRDFLS